MANVLLVCYERRDRDPEAAQQRLLDLFGNCEEAMPPFWAVSTELGAEEAFQRLREGAEEADVILIKDRDGDQVLSHNAPEALQGYLRRRDGPTG